MADTEKRLPTDEEIVEALHTLKDFCISHPRCNSECPLYKDGAEECGLKLLNPCNWDIYEPQTQKPKYLL